MLARSGNLRQSLVWTAPLFLISACTYLVNSINDIERDKTNHPERPLPSGRLSPATAAILYFALLATALLTVKHHIPTNSTWWYYWLIILVISYSYVADYLPALKAPYVAFVSTLPILIVRSLYINDRRLLAVAGALFFINLGREICLNFIDRSGDPPSRMHMIPPGQVAGLALSTQAIGIAILSTLTGKALDTLAILAFITILIVSGSRWLRSGEPKRAAQVMKIYFIAGIYFLV